MLSTLTLGWRNIWRNRRRTLINMSAIGIGLVLTVFFSGLLGGFQDEAKTQLDSSGMGHVELTAPGWRTHRSVKDVLPDPQALRATLALPPGSDVAARLVLRGLASSTHGNEAVEIHGVTFADEVTGADYAHTIRQGQAPAPDDAHGVLVGDELARRLSLTLGSKLRLMVQRPDGEMGAELFRVRGIYHSISSALSRRRVLVTQAGATNLAGVEGAHQIVIQIQEPGQAEALAQRLRVSLGPSVQVASFYEIVPILKALDSYMDSMILVISLFVYLLVGLGILNTMLMSVLERTHEFGVMQALGTRPSGVVGLVLAESFWIASLAVALGLTIGLSITWYGSHNVLLDYTKVVGEGIEMGGATMRGAFITKFSVLDGLKSARMVYIMALFVGLFPAWRVSRMRPVQALHAR